MKTTVSLSSERGMLTFLEEERGSSPLLQSGLILNVICLLMPLEWDVDIQGVMGGLSFLADFAKFFFVFHLKEIAILFSICKYLTIRFTNKVISVNLRDLE